MNIGTIALRNVFRNKKRSLLSMSAIGVAAMTITMLFSLLAGMKEDLKENAQTYSTGQVRIRNIDYDRFEQLNPLHLGVEKSRDLTENLLRTPGLSAVSPRITFPGSVFIEDERHNVMGMGVNFSLEQNYMEFDSILGKGRLPLEGRNETLIGFRLAEKLGLDIGDRITVLTTTRTRGTNAFTLEITGLLVFPLDLMNNSTMMFPLDRARHFLWMGDTVTEILLKFDKDIRDANAVKITSSVLTEMGLNNAEAKSWEETGTLVSFMKQAESIYFFIALFFFIIGSTVIINTTMMTVFERIREIGTLGAMGMEERSLVKLFFLEAFLIGVAGSLLGVITGMIIVSILSFTGIDYGEAMEGMDMGISTIIYPKLVPRSTILVFFYSLTVASLASLIPSGKAAKVEPVQALRSA